MSKLFNHDQILLEDYEYIIGIDEVGRGCLAGPLVVCGVIMKYEKIIEDINDSKKLSEKKRELLFDKIVDDTNDYFILEIESELVDKYNIYQATKLAMEKIAKKLNQINTIVLSDAMPLAIENCQPIIKGDTKSYAIACASILAKVYRDRLMIEMAETYPEYGFEKHKGYGTKQHLIALEQHGYLEKIHRKSFEPIKSMCAKQLTLFK